MNSVQRKRQITTCLIFCRIVVSATNKLNCCIGVSQPQKKNVNNIHKKLICLLTFLAMGIIDDKLRGDLDLTTFAVTTDTLINVKLEIQIVEEVNLVL